MKILFFDYWVNGYKNFIPLHKILVRNGHETVLLHVGSFNFKGGVKTQVIDGLQCFDISYYSTKYILKALKAIQPDRVISLNTTYILDRALVMACRSLKIKSIFMMHGERAIGKDIEIVVKQLNYSFIEKLLKSVKYFSTVIPNYVYSGYHNNNYYPISPIPYFVLSYYFTFPSRSFYYPPCSSELLHDYCLVYSNKYIEYYKSVGYEETQIAVVGIPKEQANTIPGNIETNNNELRDLINSDIKYALYLEDAFQEQQNMGGWTYDYLNKVLVEISKRLQRENIVLVVKLHPSTDKNKVVTNIPNLVVATSDLEYLIKNSLFCIGHISTTIITALIFKKPIIIPRWGKSLNIPDYFIKEGVANPWYSVDDGIDLEVDNAKVKSYVGNNRPFDRITTINRIYNIIVDNNI